MYLKFLFTEDFGKRLKQYHGNLFTLWKPMDRNEETHCYIELPEDDLEKFLNEFDPDDVKEIKEGSDELPNSIIGFNGRCHNFIVMERNQ